MGEREKRETRGKESIRERNRDSDREGEGREREREKYRKTKRKIRSDIYADRER